MKRKGFTLVELIAVIVVVAVIALIAVPLVMNQMENTKKEAYKTSVQSVFDALSTYLAHNTEIDDIPSAGILIPGDEIYTQLDLKNADFISGKIYRDENGVMMVESLSNGTYCASGSKNELRVTKGDCALLDITGPVISIHSSRVTSSSITIVVNSEDLESGIIDYTYFIKKESDNEYEKKATKKDNVYTFIGLDKDTTYDIKVIVKNGNGKTAEATKKVDTSSMIIDFKETPQDWSHSKTVTITYPKVTGTEVYQYQIVGKTDWITVEGTTADVLLDNPATITAKIIQDGKEILSQQYQVLSIDNVPPRITIDGNPPTWTTSKTLTIHADDGIIGSGLADEPYSFDGGKTWQKSPNSKEFTSEETVQIAARDKLGNVSEVQVVTIQKIDTTQVTGSTITAVTLNNDNTKNADYTSGTWTNKTVRLYANSTPSNAPSGYVYQWYKNDVKVGGSSKTLDVPAEGTASYKVEIKTAAGSSPVKSVAFTVKIDKTAPTCPTGSWSGESKEWATSRTIKATCTDTGGSGCTNATASKTWVFDETTETANLSYDMADNAGNTIMCNKQAADIYVDKTKPTINRKSTTSSTNSIGVNFEVTDNESGVNTDSYDCVFGTNVSGTVVYNRKGTIKNGACTITGLGAGIRYYYQITAKDKLGNTTTTDEAYVVTKSIQAATFSTSNVGTTYTDSKNVTYAKGKQITITYDKTGITSPAYFFKYTGTATNYSGSLKKCGASTPKSASECTETVPGGSALVANTWYYVVPSSSTQTTTSFRTTQNGKVYAITSDGTNVKSSPTLDINTIDNEGPRTGTITKSTTTKSVAFTYAASDSQSGFKSVACAVQGTSSSATASASADGTINSCSINNLRTGSYNYTITFTDNIGNVTTSTGTFETVNFSDCKVAVPGGWATQKTVTITGVTAGAQLQYRIGTNGTWNNISNGGTFNLISNETVYCRLTDGTNTSSGASAGVTGIDRSTPSVYISALTDSVQNIAYSEGTWTKDMVQLTANPSGSTSGYSYQWYTVSSKSGASSEYKQIVGATSQKYTITGDVNTYYVVKVTNGVGNFSYSVPFSVRRDATPPSKPTYTATRANCSGSSCVYNSGSWTNQSVNVYLQSTDSGSGISKMQWSYDNATWNDIATTVSGSNATATDTISRVAQVDRNVTIYYRVIDKVGNYSSNSINAKIDGCGDNRTYLYTNWGSCSKTCGGGIQSGTHYYRGVSGNTCTISAELQTCNTQACSSGGSTGGSTGIDCSRLSSASSYWTNTNYVTSSYGDSYGCNVPLTFEYGDPSHNAIKFTTKCKNNVMYNYYFSGNTLFRITRTPYGANTYKYQLSYNNGATGTRSEFEACLGTGIIAP